MRYQQVLILASMTVFTLAGCGHGSSSSDPSAQPNAAERIFAADPNGNATEIQDAAMLGADIDSIFGDANAEPVAINLGDSIDDVLDRAKNR